MGISRRSFLHRVGAVGGYAAAYSAMLDLGLLATPAAAAPLNLPADAGRGASVVILGGGIAGLVNAYELERAGFRVTLLEARDRIGGRNWTLRNGSKIEMVGEQDQTVTFSDGVYMNAGPARIPSHHQGLIGYCRKLGVALEVEVNSSRSAYFWDAGANGGKPVQMRQGVNDTRGYLSELLAKAINKGALDQDLTPDEKARMLPFLKAYGDLDGQMAFKGTERSGFAKLPGAADQYGEGRAPLPRADLLSHPQLGSTLFEDSIYMQATMFQPVGGMDQIAVGFERALKSPVVKNAEVLQIRQGDKGVKVVWRDRLTGRSHAIEADYSIITIPLIVLARIDTNFAPAVKTAIAAVPYAYSNKIGFESPRFWEREQIYGGISFVGGPTNLVWYPSNGLHTERGMLLACYGGGPGAKPFADKPLAEQMAFARGVVDRLHPGHGRDLEKGVVVNWNKIPFSLGPWPAYGGQGGQEGHNEDPNYVLLNKPQGRVYFSGAHLSQMPGWQEGAVFSAHRTIDLLASRVAQTVAVAPRRAAAA
ncbi:MAG: FAD-dependent oxidoreductase [Phenylobacterium sp.]